jgi:sugar diacid utilization regulator
VLAGAPAETAVVDARLLLDERRLEAGPILWVLADAWPSPRLDALLLELHRGDATALLVPVERLPESVRLLAERLRLPLLGAAQADLDPVLHVWWTQIHAERLARREREWRWAEGLVAAWRTAKDVQSFLAAASSLLGGRVSLAETGADGEGPVIDWGRGAGTALRVDLPPEAASVLPFLLAFTAVLLDQEAAAIESDLRLRGELLLELLVERGVPSGAVVRAAERFGMDLGREHLVALLQVTDFPPRLPADRVLRLWRDVSERLEAGARARFARAWILPHAEEFVLVAEASARDWPPNRTTEALDRLRSSLGPVLAPFGLTEVSVGIGFPYAGGEGLRRSFGEAREALLVGRAQFGPGRVTHFQMLGPHRFLYGWFDSPRSQSLARDLLHPLLDPPSVHNAELLETLRVYLECRGRASEAARRLGIHRNTLRYRLDRAAQLLGVDLEDAGVQLVLQLALRTLA